MLLEGRAPSRPISGADSSAPSKSIRFSHSIADQIINRTKELSKINEHHFHFPT